ncbi:hypothetical protein [Dyadobacter sp. 3J3]|uniref:helix-turn-helix transcriptional regulator n=1 Tax=Dyadobacter sp. 3J3 TaxID=2606600 RepID=UPI00190F3F0B|nr:hypothetical protein [Dyadobacter sp. 3J3]
MEKQFEKYKGIHPGIVLERELKKRSLKQRPFALSIAEHPQTFNAITKGKRNLNTALALKIEKELQLEEGTFVFLQAHYEIKEEKKKQEHNTPCLEWENPILLVHLGIIQLSWISTIPIHLYNLL